MLRNRIFLLALNFLTATGLTLALVASLQASTAACEWAASLVSLATLCNTGIGTSIPGEKLHVADGHILIEGGGETALKIKRDIVYPRAITLTGVLTETSPNPIFEIGRIIQAGDSDPELRILYTDDSTAERAVMELDRKGIIASVKQERGSHYEGFISGTDPEPIFRLNSWPKMRLEMGDGGVSPVDVAIQRETTNTLTVLVSETEQLRIDPTGIAVNNGYVKLATMTGPPPAADCEIGNSEHIGRMKMDSTGSMIYVCTAAGWGWANIFKFKVKLPILHNQ